MVWRVHLEADPSRSFGSPASPGTSFHSLIWRIAPGSTRTSNVYPARLVGVARIASKLEIDLFDLLRISTVTLTVRSWISETTQLPTVAGAQPATIVHKEAKMGTRLKQKRTIGFIVNSFADVTRHQAKDRTIEMSLKVRLQLYAILPKIRNQGAHRLVEPDVRLDLRCREVPGIKH